MGYIVHHAIIITCHSERELIPVRNLAVVIFGEDQVTKPIQAKINGYYTFLVGPDGSKAGWSESEAGDTARKKYADWLEKNGTDFAEVRYGGDEPDLANVERHG